MTTICIACLVGIAAALVWAARYETKQARFWCDEYRRRWQEAERTLRKLGHHT